jgi:cytochrome oxidase Cu insertion factor (SCO1/SenC/PrrC family)
MGEAVELIEKHAGEGAVTPVFFSVDPARDDVPQVKRYLQGMYSAIPSSAPQ